MGGEFSRREGGGGGVGLFGNGEVERLFLFAEFGTAAVDDGVGDLADGLGAGGVAEGVEIWADGSAVSEDGAGVGFGEFEAVQRFAEGPDGAGEVILRGVVGEGAHAEDGGEVVVEGDVVRLGAGREASHAALRLADGVAVLLRRVVAKLAAAEFVGFGGELGEDGFLAYAEVVFHFHGITSYELRITNWEECACFFVLTRGKVDGNLKVLTATCRGGDAIAPSS